MSVPQTTPFLHLRLGSEEARMAMDEQGYTLRSVERREVNGHVELWVHLAPPIDRTPPGRVGRIFGQPDYAERQRAAWLADYQRRHPRTWWEQVLGEVGTVIYVGAVAIPLAVLCGMMLRGCGP